MEIEAMSETTPLPCAFCGAAAEPGDYTEFVRCSAHCGAVMPTAAAWNARVMSPPAEGAVRGLVDALRAVAEGYPTRVEDDQYIVVDNPDYQPDNGANPSLVIDVDSAAELLTALSGERTGTIEECAREAERLSVADFHYAEHQAEEIIREHVQGRAYGLVKAAAAIRALQSTPPAPKQDPMKDKVDEAMARFNALSPEEQAAHRKAQQDSWVRGELAMGESSAIAQQRFGTPHGHLRMPPTHRHKKRGTEYVLLGVGKMQAEAWTKPGKNPNASGGFLEPVDMDDVAIYYSVDDGSLWVRPREDFEDGRFETLPAPTPPTQGGVR